MPDSYGIFYAENYKQVWARGFEGALEQSVKFGKDAINWSAKYNFTPSTNLKADNPQIEGKQLMYVPLHSATFNFNLKLHTANIGVDWAIRSQSNSQADRQGLPLQGYSIVNFDLNNTFFFLANSFRFDFKINNLFDKQYYTYLPAYSLPGRAFYISVTYIFNKSNY
jgi:outer membrane receptor for ferrienterochelin and colicin